MDNKSPEARFWSRVLGQNVVAVYNGTPIISIEDVRKLPDYPGDLGHRSELLRWAKRGGPVDGDS